MMWNGEWTPIVAQPRVKFVENAESHFGGAEIGKPDDKPEAQQARRAVRINKYSYIGHDRVKQ